MTIWKFPIQITDKQIVLMPSEYKIIHVGLDPREDPCVWAIVNPDSPKLQVTLLVIGTGNPMPDVPMSHVGSFVFGPFVWHVFQRD